MTTDPITVRMFWCLVLLLVLLVFLSAMSGHRSTTHLPAPSVTGGESTQWTVTARRLSVRNVSTATVRFSKVGIYHTEDDATHNRNDLLGQNQATIRMYTKGIAPFRGSAIDWSTSVYDTMSADHFVSLLPNTALVLEWAMDVSFSAVRLGVFDSTTGTLDPSSCRLKWETGSGSQHISVDTFTPIFLVFTSGDTQHNDFVLPNGSHVTPNGIYTTSPIPFSDLKSKADKATADKVLADKVVAEKVAADKALADKVAADKALADKVAADKALADKVAADKALADKVAADKVLADKVAADKVLADKVAADKVVADKALADKVAAEKVLADKVVADKVVADKVAADKVVADKALADKVAADKVATDKALADKALADKSLADKVAADKVAADKALADKAKDDKNAATTSEMGMLRANKKNWGEASVHRRTFFVTSTDLPIISGWYSYERNDIGVDTTLFVKCADAHDTSSRMCSMQYAGTGHIRILFENRSVFESSLDTDSLSSDVRGTSISGYLRPHTGQWNSMESLAVFYEGHMSYFNLLKLPERNGLAKFSDVWKSRDEKTTRSWFVTESGCTHVGGPPMKSPKTIYSYENNLLTFIAFFDVSNDRWVKYSDNNTSTSYAVHIAEARLPGHVST